MDHTSCRVGHGILELAQNRLGRGPSQGNFRATARGPWPMGDDVWPLGHVLCPEAMGMSYVLWHVLCPMACPMSCGTSYVLCYVPSPMARPMSYGMSYRP